jgi:long-subunit fatty acid transport protein
MNIWEAVTDVETLTSLHDGIEDTFGEGLSPYNDSMLEDLNYSGQLTFDTLEKNKLTFGAGIYITPLGEKLGISLGYHHGYRLNYEGDVKIALGCPPDSDALGRIAADTRGICDATLKGTGTVGYNLPSRVNLGVVLKPIDKFRLEVMGSYVMWNAFTDYDITTSIPRSEIDLDNDETAEETAALVSQNRKMARDNHNTFWVGIDGKMKMMKLFTVGGRVFYDKSAIPSTAKSANNYDLDTLGLSALAAVTPVEMLGIGLSFTRHQMISQTVTDSKFNISLDDRTQDRYFYPSANGKYTGGINRIALSVKGKFGG